MLLEHNREALGRLQKDSGGKPEAPGSEGVSRFERLGEFYSSSAANQSEHYLPKRTVITDALG